MIRTLSLTDDQRTAVEVDAARLLLLAPAGSGKTEVLTRRIERLLVESAGQAFRILAVAYTNKAAEELRHRIVATVAAESWRVDCETLHGFALSWLTRYGTAVGIGADPVVYSADADRLRIITEYLNSVGVPGSNALNQKSRLSSLLRAIDDYRTLTPDLAPAGEQFDGFGVSFAELYEAFNAALNRAGGVDFPGMLVKLRELLEVDPWVLENFRRTYRHILVDEAQDLTPVQARLLATLASEEVNLFLVADDRQAINGFAGGSFANAETLAGTGAKTLRLQHNFRCATAVLDAAERVTASGPSERVVTAVEGAPAGELSIVSHSTSHHEAVAVRDWIRDLLSNGIPSKALVTGEDAHVYPEDIAIIGRARWHLDPVVQQLVEASLPVSFGTDGAGFLNTRHGRLIFEALCAVNDPSDIPAQRRFIDELGDELGEVSAVQPESVLTSHSDSQMRALGRAIRNVTHGPVGLDQFFQDITTLYGASEAAKDVESLTSLWRRYSLETIAPYRTLRGFLRFVARAQVTRASDPGIRIMTIHKVKGLEFRAVALVNAYDGALPDYRAKAMNELESERRSLYVAMTRAQRSLRISWPRYTTDKYGRTRQQQPSRFLSEAGLIEAVARHLD